MDSLGSSDGEAYRFNQQSKESYFDTIELTVEMKLIVNTIFIDSFC